MDWSKAPRLPDDHATELVTDDDRQWFKEHPDRVLRLRHATEGDPIGPGLGHVAFVFCPVNGMRMRPGCMMLPEVSDALMAEDTDEALAACFAALLDEMAKGDRYGPDGEPAPGTFPARRCGSCSRSSWSMGG